MSILCRFCCKSRFEKGIKNSAGRRLTTRAAKRHCPRGGPPNLPKFGSGGNDILTLRPYPLADGAFGRLKFLCSDAISGRRTQHLSADMNRTRIGLAVLLIGAVAVGFSYVRKQSISDSHRQTRQI